MVFLNWSSTRSQSGDVGPHAAVDQAGTERAEVQYLLHLEFGGGLRRQVSKTLHDEFGLADDIIVAVHRHILNDCSRRYLVVGGDRPPGLDRHVAGPGSLAPN